MKNKAFIKITAIGLLFFMFMGGVSATLSDEGVLAENTVDYGDVTPVEYNPDTSLTGSIEIDLNQVINSNIIGPGVNFDFCSTIPINLETGEEWIGIHSQHIPYTTHLSESEAKKEWDNYFQLVDFMDFKYVRMSVSISMWEPVNDNNDSQNTDFENGFVFSDGYEENHPEVRKNNFLYMEAMYKILDHFEKTGKYVVLANWDRGGGAFCPDGKNWLAQKKPDGSDYSMSDRDRLYVTDLEEYTESIAAIMYHLKVEKGYNCVKGISFWNEPEHLIDYENVLTSVYNSLGGHFRRLGIRDKVLIQAYDGSTFWNNEKGWVDDQVSRMISKCGDNMDIIAIHDYFSRMDSLKNTPDGVTHGTLSEFQLPRLIKPAVTQATSDGKERIVVMGELGTFAFGGKDETTQKNYKLQLHNAEAIIMGLNNGVKGFGNWVYNLVYHKYYAMLEVGKNQYREFTPDDTNYYPTSLYTKYIKSGSDVVETSVSGLSDSDGQRVHCVSVKKDNDITVLLVNDASTPAAVKLQGLPEKTFYQHYVQDGKTDRIYPGVNYEPAKNNEICLRPQSITVLTTYSYGTQTVRETQEEIRFKDQDLKAYYNFEIGSQMGMDISGNNNSLVSTKSKPVQISTDNTDLKLGKAAKFNAQSALMPLGAAYDQMDFIDNLDEYTLSMFFQNTKECAGGILFNNKYLNDEGIRVSVKKGTVTEEAELWLDYSYINSVGSTQNFLQCVKLIPAVSGETDQSWHHVALVVNKKANSIKLYFDGIAVHENRNLQKLLADSQKYPASFGAMIDPRGPASSYRFDGALDEIRVYSFAANNEEVAILSQNGLLTHLFGDANDDGELNVLDAVQLRNYLLNALWTSDSVVISFDIDNNRVIDIFDLCIIKDLILD